MTVGRHLVGIIVLFGLVEILLVGWIDRPLTLWAHGLDQSHHALIDSFRFYTDWGLGKWYAWPSAVGFILCMALSKGSRDPHRRHQTRYAAACCAFFFVTTSAAGLITDAIKPLIGQARPKLLFDKGFYGFVPLSFSHDLNALPSGHTTTAFAVAATLTLFWPRAWTTFYFYALAIALSRLMVCAHYGADLVAGAMVGIGVTKGCVLLLRYYWPSNPIMVNNPKFGQDITIVDRNNPISLD